jgi:N-acyl-D-aspartate/D-glutamate deacylase
MICTDSGLKSRPGYHPRMRGSFPRTLGRYVRERKVTSLPEMIRKMTAMPAAVYGLKTKGLIWDNMDADICIFDPEKIIDKASFTDCKARAEGLNYVIVGGEVVAENAVFNGKKCAKVLLRED